MPRKTNPDAPYWRALETTETRMITEALTATGGRLGEAASLLGINRVHLGNRMRALGIDRKSFTQAASAEN